MQLIGLMGSAGSGKDTVGQYLRHRYDYHIVSFADGIKDSLAVIFGWDREMLSGHTAASRSWRETIDPWWSEHLCIPDFTPRLAMTMFGSDVMRRWFHDDIWILNTKRKIAQLNGKVAITDLRFQIEINMIRQQNGIIIRVCRGPEPIWHSVALDAIAGDPIARLQLQDEYKVHPSEWEWRATQPCATLHNDGNIENLNNQIDDIIRSVG